MRQRNKQSTIKQRNKTKQGKTRQASKNNNQEQKNNQRLTTSNHEQEETIKSANISRPDREIIGESNVNDLQPHRTSCAESPTWWCFGAKLMNSFSDYVFGRSPAYYHHMRCEHVCVFSTGDTRLWNSFIQLFTHVLGGPLWITGPLSLVH